MAKASEYINYLKEAVKRQDLYVYGANGESIADLLPRLTKMETGSNLTEVLTLISKRVKDKLDLNIVRGEDCSGLVVKFLMDNSIIKYDMTADDIYEECEPISFSDLQPGDFVFKVGKKKVNNKEVSYMSHIGSYIGDGLVIEAKGRKYGVVTTELSNTNWAYAGRPPFWESDTPVIKRKLKYTEGKPLMKGEDVRAVQQRLVALGYSVGKSGIDGEYGQNTSNAVTDFQADYKVDKPRTFGVVGKTTALALGLEWGG